MPRESDGFNNIGSKFVTLPGETLILAQRKHWYSFVLPISIIGFIASGSIIGLIFLSSIFISYIQVILSFALFIAIIATTFIGNLIVDWYFNFYVITSKKIIEVSYKPLASRHTNEILLDQVKCTEIDTRVEGIMHEILDIGDVVITFDRPTREEEFVMFDMADPKKIESNLENALTPTETIPRQSEVEPAAWYEKQTSEEKPRKWRYMEGIGLKGN